MTMIVEPGDATVIEAALSFEALDQGTLPSALHWVKDAPLFIDDANLNRFYDAVVRPAFKENAPRTIKMTEAQKNDLQAKLGGSGKVGVPGWLSSIFSADFQVSAEGGVAQSNQESKEHTVVLEPISTPQRQLEQLMAFYVLRQPTRLLAGGPLDTLVWQETGRSQSVPRALALIDLPVGMKLIPTAAEFDNGKVATLYDQLLAKSGERPPKLVEGRVEEYWAWFAANYDPNLAMQVIEKASAENGRIQWIDFRVPVNDRADTMHLHLEAGGRYFTGTLAYQLVRRGVSHGTRLVGTLKDGPDFNVLAIYEK